MLIKHHCVYIGVLMESIWASPVCFFWWLPVLLLVYSLWFHLLLGLAPLTLDVDQTPLCVHRRRYGLYLGFSLLLLLVAPCASPGLKFMV